MNGEDEKFQDIKPQEKRGGDFLAPQEKQLPITNYPSLTTNRLPRGIGWGIFALVAIFIVGTFFSFRVTSDRIRGTLERNLERFEAGVDDLKNLDAKSAGEKFSRISGEIGNLDEAVGKFSSFFGSAGSALLGFQKIAAEGAVLAAEIDFLQANAFDLFLNQGGGEFLDHLRRARDALRAIDEEGKKLASAAESLRDLAPLAGEFYLPFSLDTARFLNFLDSLLAWLDRESGRHVLLLLQNPSEIRPAGGFLGSYAEMTVKKGQLESVSVHDINEVDRTFDLKIIPPRPLQVISTSWRAADSNWFFDFSMSAKKVIEFFESSNLYKDKVAFDAAVAASPKVIGDILAVIGPIDLPSRKLTISEDNFLIELQKIVQEGQASRATYPKKILEEAAPILLSRLTELDAAKKNAIWALAGRWISEKDLQFYFKDDGLQNFAKFYGATGELYELPAGFAGDYLAVVDANIDGGKSDLYIRQNVLLEMQMNLDGTASHHLVIDRAHEGNKSKYWWYKETNQNYLQIFVPTSAQLTNFKGGVDKKITPKDDYAKGGYKSDALVSEIESSEEALFNYPAVRTHKESGKKVFSTWSATKASAKTQISFDYTTRLGLAPQDGARYQFIFEKQAGTSRSYKFQINAPVGFRFAENGLPVYTYELASMVTSTGAFPGRLILDLTLEKI